MQSEADSELKAVLEEDSAFKTVESNKNAD